MDDNENKNNKLPQFYISSPEDIKSGKTTDVYFLHTKKILQKYKLAQKQVVAEITIDSFPDGYNWGVFCGLEEVINLLSDIPVDLYSLPEGTVFPAWASNGVRIPVMVIEGPYGEFCVYETPILGLVCQASGIATKTARLRKLAGDEKILFSFGIRRMHPAIAPMIDRSAYIGGVDYVSCVASAEKLGIKPRGTMPHALVIMFRSQEEAFKAFDDVMEADVPRICLVDTYYDEKAEAIIATESVNNLWGIRLDTPTSRKGNIAQLVKEIRWELNIRGYKDVKIFVSGGIDEESIRNLADSPVDGFGIGTNIANAKTLNFAMDIVELEGEPVAKRGKFSGKKEVWRCPVCFVYIVCKKDGLFSGCAKYDTEYDRLLCPKCGHVMDELLVQYLKKGKLEVAYPEAIDNIRKRTLSELKFINF